MGAQRALHDMRLRQRLAFQAMVGDERRLVCWSGSLSELLAASPSELSGDVYMSYHDIDALIRRS
jgi:hypothetical protein